MKFTRSITQPNFLYLGAQPALLRYGLAVLAVVAAAIATRYIPVIGERAAFLLFFFAIIQSSFWLGRNPGLLTMILSLLPVNALVLLPAWISRPYDVFILNAGFCILSGFIIATTSLNRGLTSALWESRQRYTGIVESAMYAIITINAEQRILLFNAAAEKMFACKADEAIGVSIERFIPERFRTAHSAHIRAFGRTGITNRKMGFLGTITGLRASGEEFPIEVSISQTGLDDEKSFTAILRDITERQRGEFALQERLRLQDQLVKVAASVPGLICSFRLRPDGSSCMPYASPVIESIYGFSHEVVAEDFSPVFARIHPDDTGHIHATIAESARTLQPWQDSYRYNHPAKGEAWHEGHSIPLREMDGSILWHGYIRDVTVQKHAEAALEESESHNRFLANILENSNQPFGTSFPDGRLEYVNPAFERLTGYSRDELLALDWATELTPSEWQEAEQAKLEELRSTLHAVRYEKEYFRKDGTRVPIELLVELKSTDAGEPIRYYAFITDLTERKQAKAALRESEERMRLATEKHLYEQKAYHVELEMQNEELRQVSVALEKSRTHFIELYDFAPVGYLTLTTEGMIAEINLTAAKLLGVERNKLIHWRFAKFIADEHKDNWYKFSLRAMQQDGKQCIELPLRREDGTGLFIHFDCEYKQAGDALPLLHIALTDITERTLAETALRESETRLALVVEEVKAGYWDWDLMTNSVYLSPEWKRQIGFDENELLDRWEEWECRLHPDDRALVSAETENYIAGLLPVFEVEFRLRHKDGSYRWIHSRGGLLRDQNSHPYRMLGINLDITDFKKTKELSERRDQMEQSFRLSVAGQTVAAIAHELNQPLAAISSYADVALYMLQTGNRNPQKLSHVLENCALQAQRAGDVIRQLMAVLHKDETISEPVDINSSVREALDFVKADSLLGVFKIKPDLAAGLPPVAANSLQIQKVLVNLLRNGLESMQESGINAGTMTVTTRSFLGDPAMAKVTVCDSGKGVADTATLKTMFQPFYTTKPSGLGMGLAISRALIEAHGGKMWAEQNAGMGISIHFTLPFVI